MDGPSSARILVINDTDLLVTLKITLSRFISTQQHYRCKR